MALTFGEEPVSDGLAIFLIFVVIYMFAFIYLLFRRYFSGIILDLVYLTEEKGGEQTTLFVYCFLNSICIFMYNIVSMFVSETDIGLATSLGTDFYNILLLYAVLSLAIFQKSTLAQKSGGNNNTLDAWYFLRNTILYIVLISLISFFMYIDVKWWMGLSLLFYFIIFFVIVSKNESIKNYIYRMIGLTHEDDSFNAEELTKQQKNSIALEYLIKNRFINHNAVDLKKKIAKNEGLVVLHHGKESQKGRVLMNFHKAVYTIMFAIRNKNKHEKRERSKMYANLWKNEDDYDDFFDGDDDDDSEESEDKQSNDGQESEPSIQNYQDQAVLDKINIAQKSQLLEKNDDQDQSSIRNNYNQNADMDSQKRKFKSNVIIPQTRQMMSDEDTGSKNNQEYDENEDDDDEEDDEEFQLAQVNLTYPKDTLSRVSYIIFFPLHLILYCLPKHFVNPSIIKLLKCFLLILLLLALSVFFIELLVSEICRALNFKTDIVGFIFVSFGFSLPFMVQNYKQAQKEFQNVDFYQTFIQLGIFKQSFILSISWILNCIVNSQSLVLWTLNENMKYYLTVYSGIIIVFLFFFQLVNGLKINKIQSVVLIAGFIFMLIFAFINFYVSY